MSQDTSTKHATLSPATPMLNVSDIEKTISWYEGIGFEVLQTSKRFLPEEPVNWAYLKRGDASLMLNLNPNQGGEGITLYMNTDDVDGIYQEIRDRVKLVEDIRDQFYKMRDFYFQDINGYKIGIGQPID